MADTPCPVRIGSTALEFVRLLPSVAPRVARFNFAVYEPTAPLAERLSTTVVDQSAVLERAAAIQRTTGETVPYWEAVIAASWAENQFEVFANEALRHDSTRDGERTFQLTAEDLAGGTLDGESKSLEVGQVMALDSRCTFVDGTPAHLPLMDFRLLPKAGDLPNVQLALRAIGEMRGAILHSGRSYHYYGFEPVSAGEWLAFSARCLMLAPLTDSRYIAHRLLAGGGTLRLTCTKWKPQSPCVAALL